MTYSPDGRWWWNGQQWVPAGRPAPAPAVPTSSWAPERPGGERLPLGAVIGMPGAVAGGTLIARRVEQAEAGV
jgi:hypothetical protein